MSINRSHLREAVSFITANMNIRPRIGLILGSGLGDLAEQFSNRSILDTHSIPHYPKSSVEGHRGRLVFAHHRSIPLVAFQGRVHFYETNDVDAVLFPVHVAHELGVKILLVTNAAGGINRRFSPGELMLITDQINLTTEYYTGDSTGIRLRKYLFDNELQALISQLAEINGITIRKGVYAGVKGPSYETAAEVEMINRLGGDAVGMSTVLETSLAAYLGIRVAGISCITNKATGIGDTKLSHDEVTLAAEHARADFTRLVLALVERL
jgi:purine-nucleoside phosphorylase